MAVYKNLCSKCNNMYFTERDFTTHKCEITDPPEYKSDILSQSFYILQPNIFQYDLRNMKPANNWIH